MKTRKLITLFSLTILSFATAFSQPLPLWRPVLPPPTNPFIGTTTTFTIPVNYGIDVAGTVYIIVMRGVYPDGFYSSGDVRFLAQQPLAGDLVGNAVVPVSGLNINTILQTVFTLALPNQPYTVFLVAANSVNALQLVPVRILTSTKPCPSIFVLTGFDNDQRCVNPPGADKLYAFGFATGVFAGATWTINWGDGGGDQLFFTSLADNQTPPNQTHTYTVHDSCVLKAVLTVKNTNVCAPTGALVEEKSVLLAGRDWDPDGNGLLLVSDSASARTDIIYVCEGIETKVAIQDISTWDCQPGSFPNPPGEANNKPRTLQWVYGGQVPNGAAGAGLNTITGNVLVQGLGTAIKGGVGVIGDTVIRNTIGYKSNTMIIPATAVAGEEFHVAFKNWNICNPFVGLENNNSNYVNVNVIIRVISSPPRPVVDSIDICEGGTVADRTFHVTSPPVGVLNWYAIDPVLNPLAPIVFTGADFPAPLIPAGTSKKYWVVDAGIPVNGITCKSRPREVTLRIRNGITNNTIAAAQTICYNDTPAALTGLVPLGGNGTFVYQWRISTTGPGAGFANIPGANGQNYTPPGPLTANTWYRRRVTSVNCLDDGNPIAITVNPLPTITLAAIPNSCIGATTFTVP